MCKTEAPDFYFTKHTDHFFFCLSPSRHWKSFRYDNIDHCSGVQLSRPTLPKHVQEKRKTANFVSRSLVFRVEIYLEMTNVVTFSFFFFRFDFRSSVRMRTDENGSQLNAQPNFYSLLSVNDHVEQCIRNSLIKPL